MGRLPSALLAFVVGLWAAAVSAAEPQPAASVATCAGGDTLVPLARRWAEAVHARTPALEVRVDPHAKLAADGFAMLLKGEADCALFVREPFPAEAAAFQARFGHPPVLIPVARGSFATRGGTHAIAVYVNAANPLAGLTLQQLDALFSAAPRRGGRPATTWGDLGLAGEWAERPIHRYGMVTRRESGNPPGVVNFIQRRVLLDAPFRDDIAAQADHPGEQALAAIVRRVAEDPEGIGYSGFGYAQAGARPLPLAEAAGQPFVAGTPETVASGRYPLARTVYLMVAAAPGSPMAPALTAFVQEALSPEGQAMTASDPEGFLPLRSRTLVPAHAAACEPGMPHAVVGRLSPPVSAPYLTENGAVRIVGYNDMAGMVGRWSDAFAAAHPGFRFDLDLRSTRSAPPALTAGRSALAPMGAPFTKGDLQAYAGAVGGAPLQIAVAHASLDPHALSGPLAVMVDKASPLRSLTWRQVGRLFTAQGPHTWRELGVTGAVANRPIRKLGLKPGAALALLFEARAQGGVPLAPDLEGYGHSTEVVAHLAGDPTAIGFAAANTVTAATRIVPIVVRGKPILPTPATLRNGRYPLDRTLLIAVRSPVQPWVRDYLDLVLSCEGQRIVTEDPLGYLPLSAAEVRRQRRQIGES